MNGFSPRTRYAAVLVVAGAIATALVAGSQLGARESRAKAAAPGVEAQHLFAGIPQRGAVLGRADAPVTVVEYADLQCPYCAEWATRTLPILVRDYVRTGRVRLVFRGLAFLGPDSDTALRAALAAGSQNKLWNFVHALYANQGAENSGWVTDDLLRRISGEIGLDADRWYEGRSASSIDAEIARGASAARAARVPGTPAFQVGRTGGKLQLLQLTSLEPEGFLPAIDAALAG